MPNSTSFVLAQYSFLISVPNGHYKSATAIIAWFSVLAGMDSGWVWRQNPLSRVLQLLVGRGNRRKRVLFLLVLYLLRKYISKSSEQLCFMGPNSFGGKRFKIK